MIDESNIGSDDALDVLTDQYIVSAILFEEGAPTVMKVITVTDDSTLAKQHDVTSYVDTNWSVILEHIRVTSMGVISEQVGIQVLYPRETQKNTHHFDA